VPEYVALQSIQINGVFAYHAGDSVPEANVAVHGYEVGTQVAEVDSEQARTVLAGLSGLAPGEQPETGPSFDPRRHSVPDVNAYLDDADDDEKARVLAAERESQHRKGIVEGPHAAAMPAPDVAEAEPVEQPEFPDVAEV
jgi:hypothetical protein